MTTTEEVRRDVDREAAWNTAWIGGIPLEFLSGGKAEMKVLRLLKVFGKIMRVTVRKKKEQVAGDFKSWAFVTFQEARSVSMAMRDGVRLPDYAVQLRIEPADVEGELEKNGQGALGEKWAEQQAKVLQAKAKQKAEAAGPPRRRSSEKRRSSSTKSAPPGADEDGEPRRPDDRNVSVNAVKAFCQHAQHHRPVLPGLAGHGSWAFVD